MNNDNAGALAQLEQYEAMLASIETVPQAQELISVSKAAEVYARQKRLGEEAEAYARRVRISAERELGKIIASLPKNPGVRGRLAGGSREEPPEDIPTLKDMGLSKKESMIAQQLARLPDHLFDAVAQGRMKLKNALREMQQADVTEPPPLPQKRFQVLVIDPPWEYGLRDGDATHRNRTPYPTMRFEQLIDLPVPDLLTDGVLWLWTTNNHMPDACRLLMAWGFELKTILTWVKMASTGNPHIGVGHWLRNATEHCLLATAGRVQSFSHLETLKAQSTVLIAPKSEHSAKPEEFYDLVEGLCPGGEKLELFARRQRPGWQCWGNQVGDDLED
jgi:N6-adenosine-specific RNA methylase IME4